MYIPNPVDTKDVKLPEGLEALCEQIARNTHEVWARGRMAEGWRYGPARDDSHKLHPGLVPYEDLPESEKEYDRRTTLESLKVIYKFGYEIIGNRAREI